MKISKTSDDIVLEGFFAQMKEKDRDLALPPYIRQKKSRFRILAPIGIAAALLLWFLVDRDTDYPRHQDTIIITLEEGADQELKFSIKQTSAMDVWEPSTSSLLTEF